MDDSRYKKILKRRFNKCREIQDRIFEVKGEFKLWLRKHKIRNVDNVSSPELVSHILKTKTLIESLREELRIRKKVYFKHKFKNQNKMAVKKRTAKKPAAKKTTAAKKKSSTKTTESKGRKTAYDYPEGLTAAEKKKFRVKMRALKKKEEGGDEETPKKTRKKAAPKAAAKKTTAKKPTRRKKAAPVEDDLDD